MQPKTESNLDNSPRKKIRLGDLLVTNGAISAQDLQTALAAQKQSGHKLGDVLVELGLVKEELLLDLLSKQLNIPYIDLMFYKIKPEVVRKLPETYARRFRVLILEETAYDFLIGFSDPTDLFAYDELVHILKRPLRQAVVRESDLLYTLETVYRRTEEINTLAQELQEEITQNDVDLEQILQQNRNVEDAPVVRLLQTIFEDAVIAKSSDIHIEPDENILRIRQRVDGILHEQEMAGRRIAPALVSRIKLISGLNISEKRLPQDGRFNIRVKNKSIDVRISTMPIQFGESVVMRLLDQSGGILDLDQIGMPESILQRFRQHIHRPHGIVLVTGPTGSGKTTTLYSALHELNTSDKKIITVEDPVEYRLPRINQVNVNDKIGLTFAKVLRTALRQDPDVILVGEMRDQETVEIGLRASMTGHFVLSTLHTNDAISTVTRLLDMNAQGYLLAGSLVAILAQRLVRRICEKCVAPDELAPHHRTWLYSMIGKEKADSWQFKRGKGCPFCSNNGYKGRTGVYELLDVDPPLAEALRRDDNALFAKLAKGQKGFRTLTQSTLALAIRGITTMDEVMRIAGGSFEEETRIPARRESSASTTASEATQLPSQTIVTNPDVEATRIASQTIVKNPDVEATQLASRTIAKNPDVEATQLASRTIAKNPDIEATQLASKTMVSNPDIEATQLASKTVITPSSR